MSILVGRTKEVGALEDVLSAVRGGLSGVLVLHGEVGVGKTALLDWAAGTAADMRVVRVSVAETEADLGFAGLHQLLAPLLDGLDRLPGPQRAALELAFGRSEGPPPDRFLVGLAALTLLTDAAAARPVLCVVDNGQWLDSESAEVLGFVARRLLADQVGMLFAVREGERRAVKLSGLPELPVTALSEQAAREVLAEAAGGQVDARVSERIVAETAGNPLGLVEFGRELTVEERSGAVPLTGPLRFGGRLEKLYLSRVQALPADIQALLLIAAADQLGDPAKVWRAASWLGIDHEAADLSAVERLVTLAPGLQFRHPLMRSIVYYGAPVVARWRVHEALAAASDPKQDPDRRAWHLAQAAPGPDEAVAGELERSAGRARGRGGWASSAAFLERSAELTPAAKAKAGSWRPLRRGWWPGKRRRRGPCSTARCPIRPTRWYARGPGGLRAPSCSRPGKPAAAAAALLAAAQTIGPSDARLARDVLLEALAAQLWGGQDAATGDIPRLLRSVPRAPRSPATAGDLLLDGFAAVAEGRLGPGAGLLRQAVVAVTDGQPVPGDAPQRFLAFRLAATELYDDSAWRELTDGWVARTRDRGALAATVVGLGFQAVSQLAEGRFAASESTITEARTLAEAMRNQTYLDGLAAAELELLACRGDQAGARLLAERLSLVMTGRGHGLGIQQVQKALATLELGLGRYEQALRHARAAVSDGPLLKYQSGPELLIEAAVRSGDRAAAAAALTAVAPWWQACGTSWSLGLLARCQALLADDDHAEDAYRLSVEHLRHCQVTPELARSHLLYGEWLRRRRRRRGAREQLRVACELFGTLGMTAFAERAGAELRAAGEHAAVRPAGTRDALTPQEAQIARLAAEGATNREIASRLFVSASTVDYHLRKVFRNLGVTRRAQLTSALSAAAGAEAEAGPAAVSGVRSGK